jgi:hypothetical protein
MNATARWAAWLALAVVASAHVWILFDTLGFLGVTKFPPDLIVWVVLIIPWTIGSLAPLAGAWLLAKGAAHGGGRLGWRWWLAGLLLLYWGWLLFMDGPIEEPGGAGLHLGRFASWLDDLPLALAAILIWLLARDGERARS